MSAENELWDSTPAPQGTFDPKNFGEAPPSAQKYLSHAIRTGTPMASAVRVQMTGQIRIGRWMPFTATQVVRLGQGFNWAAVAHSPVGSISGFDQLFEGKGQMQWKLFGFIPVMVAKGPDITRSAGGRMACESILLPTTLAEDDVTWSSTEAGHPVAHVQVGAEEFPLALTLGNSGRLESIMMPRWGNPEGGACAIQNFGGIIEKERTFGAFTIPSKVRMGWHFGTDRFSTGEFFRCEITHAEFR
ncbi:MAG: DUF6920 family protein [Fimbriimonas sp.]